jgi:hypothetical protein
MQNEDYMTHDDWLRRQRELETAEAKGSYDTWAQQLAKDCAGTHVNTAVVRPTHYTSGSIECIDAIESALTPEEFKGFLKGNVIKYTWRHNRKNGIEDLDKADWYLARLRSFTRNLAKKLKGV